MTILKKLFYCRMLYFIHTVHLQNVTLVIYVIVICDVYSDLLLFIYHFCVLCHLRYSPL